MTTPNLVPPQPIGRRWLAGVLLAVAIFVFARVRSQVALYVDLHRWLDGLGIPPWLRGLDHTLLLVLGSLLAARLAFGTGQTLRGLGVRASLPRGAAFALLAALPMVLEAAAQCALTGTTVRLDSNITRSVLVAPVVEELFFRAVLVAIPVRCGGWPFWPTAIFAALVFGSVHVPWTSSFHAGHLGVLAATGAGGLWYAWLLRSHDWNLWTTIVLHAAMNGAWTIFGVAGDAAGGVWPNVGRALTIVVGTVLTLRRLRSRAQRANAAA